MHKNSFVLSNVLLLLFITFLASAQTKVDSLKSLVANTNGEDKAKILIKLGYYLSSDDPNQAIIYLDQAIEITEQTNNRWHKADALFNKGVALWHLGKIEESDKYYKNAKIIYAEYEDTLSLMKVLSSEAINLSMKGETDIALENFLTVLSYAKKKNDRLTIFNSLFNMGIIFDNNGELDKALNHYKESLDYADDKSTRALVENYIAEVYLTQKQSNDAESFLIRAIRNGKLSNDDNSLVWSYTNLGNLNLINKNYAIAEKYLSDALQIARKTDYKLNIIHSLAELGTFYNETNNYQKAEKYLLEAFGLANNLGYLKELSRISGLLSSTYMNLNNYKKAYEYLQDNKNFSDSLFEIDKKNKLAEVETKYSVKQKEKEAEGLRKENEFQSRIINVQTLIAIIVSILGLALLVLVWLLVRNRQKMMDVQRSLIEKNKEVERNQKEINEKNKELQNLNSTKDKFFSIIAHDLRNPIAAFVSVSEILESEYDRLDDEDKKSLLSQMNSSSKNLIGLLENLLTWARLSNNNLEVIKKDINLFENVESAVYPYFHMAENKQVILKININDNIVIRTDPYVLRTIISNLVNNAIKFSNGGGTITISQKSDNGKFKLTVKDDGVGIEESRIESLFNLGIQKSSPGTNNEKGTGLGLVLVKDLIDKLNWHINVNSKVNEGSEFIITINE
jgi:signal transduction histidine kinase